MNCWIRAIPMQERPKVYGVVLSLANVVFDRRRLRYRAFVGLDYRLPGHIDLLADAANTSLQPFNLCQLLLKAFSTCPGIARLRASVL